MIYSIYTILMIIRITGTVLTLNLLIINSVGENRRNVSLLLQNFKDNQIKYSKDELLEIRKNSKTRLYTWTGKCGDLKSDKKVQD